MSDLAPIITSELEEGIQLKNPKAFHRGMDLLLSTIVKKEEHQEEHRNLNDNLLKLNNNVELIALEMREGFKRMDERFAAVDKRFESVDKRFEDITFSIAQRFETMERRFNRQTALISLGFVATTTILTVMKIWG